MKIKKCTECKKIKSVTEFHKSFRDGYVSKCKKCKSYLYKNRFNKPPKKEKKCPVCDNIFMPKLITSKHCSLYCSKKASRNRFHNKQKIKKCQHCKKEFKPYNTIEKYCSRDCAFKSQKYKRLGKKNPAYRNGNYIKGSKKTSKNEHIFDKNKKEIIQSMINEKGYVYCQFCNTSNSLRFENHHIVFRSEKPLHKNLHDKINIIHLCIQCHNNFHKNKGLRNDIVKERKLNELFGNDVLNKRVYSNVNK